MTTFNLLTSTSQEFVIRFDLSSIDFNNRESNEFVFVF